MNVGLLCSVAIMPRADRLADLLQELWLSSGRKLANGIIQSVVDHRKGAVSRCVCVDVIHKGALVMPRRLAIICSIHHIRRSTLTAHGVFSGPGTKHSTMLSFFRWNISDRRAKFGMRFGVKRSMLYRGARRVLAEKVVAPPISRWPDRPRNKSASTIGTDIVQNVIDARRTERAFIAANPRIERIGRQCFIAVFARRSEFQHRFNLLRF